MHQDAGSNPGSGKRFTFPHQDASSNPGIDPFIK